MKKLKIFTILLLLVSAVGFIGYRVYTSHVQDTVPPVISMEKDVIKVPINASDQKLLKGVTATDNVDGDVTDSLVVESLSDFTDDKTRIVTYVATDESGNVTRAERTVKYKDYKSPKFALDGPLVYTVGDYLDLFEYVSAKSDLDGDLTSQIKYSLDEVISTDSAGEYPIEYRVTDSAGKTAHLKTSVKILDREDAGIQVELKKYLIYLSKGDKFDPDKYFKGTSLDSKSKSDDNSYGNTEDPYELTVKSNVNTKETGTYKVDYKVKSDTQSGMSRLVVIVR